MRRGWAYAGLALFLAGGGALAFGLTRPATAPEPVAASQEECDTCSARKKDMSRLRDVLGASDTGQD